MKELLKNYDFKESEERIYKLWEESGFFNPDNLKSGGKSFTIIMPPPNANGSLHIGHALFVTLQDIIIRFERMRGRKTLWLLGADHAGFETQVVYDKKLEKEGRNRYEIPREKLWQEIWEFTQTNKKVMENQLRRLGASCDWSREKFTLDPDIIKIVYETFKKLYDDGLVYRANRSVNWCIKHQTTLSDLEVKHQTKLDKLYFVKYRVENSDEVIVIATTRPETIPADVAIAINPKSRWKKYLGQRVINPLTNSKVEIIEDSRVDIKFGSGALKITPHHDALDFEIWKDHEKEIKTVPISVIDQFGKIINFEKLNGLKIQEARLRAVELLGDALDSEPENYEHQVAICYKCNTIIEPRIMMQWFIKMTSGKNSLRDLAMKAVKDEKIKFIPERFKKVFMHWMNNLRDWNISRQIVWGIRIPAWYHEPKCIPRPGHEEDIKRCEDLIISDIKPKCEFCDAEYVQDPDVFDTWFSSGQWPFATLLAKSGNSKSEILNPKQIENDFKKFYPTDVMETGWDILFYWVARMIMLGIYQTKKVPFKTVYLHGLVRDQDRQKMSKSKGNVIDPLGVVDIYGADALRMALIIGNTAGNDIVISEDKIRGYRNFVTKIWNASRFIMMNPSTSSGQVPSTSVGIKYTAEDKDNLKEFEKIKNKVTKYLAKYDFHHAGETIYHYFWHTFADKIIEDSKPRLVGNDSRDKTAALNILLEILSGSLKLLHPFMPFITEEIYQILPIKDKKSFLMIEKW